ncbi:MAG: tetratricopeptide repeat protein [Nitrospirae bacterium]|nr:tetratricopeptide repeat protein [Candidatus Manganitrophaceae bacterium]
MMYFVNRIGIFALLTLLAACTSPEAKKAEYLERAELYFENQQYGEAIIEYKNAIQIDPENASYKYKLALVYLKRGEVSELKKAFQLLDESIRLDANNVDAHLKAGMLYLISNAFKEARKKGMHVIEKEPDNLEGYLLLGNAYAGEEEFPQAIRIMKQAIDLKPKQINLHLNLALFYQLNKDMASAEASYKHALEIDENSIDAHLALANFYQSTHDDQQAKKLLSKSIEMDPENIEIRLNLASFYAEKDQKEDAEKILRAATEMGPKNSSAWIALGDLYLSSDKEDLAIEQYKHALKIDEDAIIAKKKLIILFFKTNKLEEIDRYLTQILKKHPRDAETMALRGRWFSTQNRIDEAVDILRKAVTTEPGMAIGHYYLGVAYLAQGNDQKAKVALSEAIRIAPKLVEARTALAGMNLAEGDTMLAAKETATALTLNPDDEHAQLINGDIAFEEGDFDKALKIYKKVLALRPNFSDVQMRLGEVYRKKEMIDLSIQAYEKVLLIHPEQNTALAKIVSLLLKQGKVKKALSRTKTQLTRSLNPAPIHQMIAQIHTERKDFSKAETRYIKALEIDPTLLSARMELGNLYARQERYEEAITALEEVKTASPKRGETYILLGLIYQERSEYEKAKKEYEAVLKIDPAYVPAANNLAWLYAEHGGNIDMALSLAQKAREKAPHDPGIADTLGWIYYKKNTFLKAIGLLEESVEKLPDEPGIHYRLGMAYFKAEKKELAKKELSKALKLSKNFKGAEEARSVLRDLQ